MLQLSLVEVLFVTFTACVYTDSCLCVYSLVSLLLLLLFLMLLLLLTHFTLSVRSYSHRVRGLLSPPPPRTPPRAPSPGQTGYGSPRFLHSAPHRGRVGAVPGRVSVGQDPSSGGAHAGDADPWGRWVDCTLHLDEFSESHMETSCRVCQTLRRLMQR